MVNLEKLAEAQEAADAAMEAAALAADKIAEAMPAPEPGKAPRRVPMTFRITTEAHEHLRRLAYETRLSQQALIDEALALLVAAHIPRRKTA